MHCDTKLFKKGALLHKTLNRRVGPQPSEQNIDQLSKLMGLQPAYIFQAIRYYVANLGK
ncbi:MAG: hypothetical protein HQL47_06955 [Gammaproteobacteria bacterium]|nr:hypothetical protein [Gammaproteobacteria bacterium]